MMSEQSALTFLARRREALFRDIDAIRKQMGDSIKALTPYLDQMPPSACQEAQRLISSYKDILKRLEGF